MKSVVQRVMRISSPRPVVYAVLSDVRRWTEWYTGCEKSNVLESTGKTMLVELIFNSMMRVPFTAAFDLEEDQLITFKLVSSKYRLDWGTTYRLMDARDGRGCVVIAEADLDVLGTVPRFITDHMLNARLSDIEKALEKRAAAQKALMPVTVNGAGKPVGRSHRTKRAKCLLRIIRTAQGDQIWYQGKTFPSR